jgi:hypothetical protein
MENTLLHSCWQLVHSSVAGAFACMQGQPGGGGQRTLVCHACSCRPCAPPLPLVVRSRWAAARAPWALLPGDISADRPPWLTNDCSTSNCRWAGEAGRPGRQRAGALSGIQLLTVNHTVCSVQFSGCKHLAADSSDTALTQQGTAGVPGIGTASRRCHPCPVGRCRLHPRRGGAGVRGGALRWA